MRLYNLPFPGKLSVDPDFWRVGSLGGTQDPSIPNLPMLNASGGTGSGVTPADGFQAQTGDAAGVSATYSVSPAEGNQAQVGDAATVRAVYLVTGSDGFQTQTGDIAVVSYAGPTMSWDVTPGDGFQAQAGDTATVRTTYLVSPVDGFQTQTCDSAVVFAGYLVISDQGFQTQTMDEVTVSLLSAAASQTPKRKTIKAEDTQLIATGFVDKVSVVMKGEPPYP